MPPLQHDTRGSHVDWIFMAIKYLCRSLSLAHSLFFAALQLQITMTHFLLTNYSKQFQFRQRAIQLVASHKLAGKRRGVLQRVWNRLAQRASESSALRVGSDCLGMRNHAFQKKNVCFVDVKRPRSSAVLLIRFWHFLGPLWTQTFALRLGNPLFLLFWPNVSEWRTQVEKLMLKEKHRMSWQWMTAGHLRSLLEHHKRPKKPHMNSMLNGCSPTLHTRWGTFHHFEIYNIQYLRHGGGTRCRCEWKCGTEASRFRL